MPLMLYGDRVYHQVCDGQMSPLGGLVDWWTGLSSPLGGLVDWWTGLSSPLGGLVDWFISTLLGGHAHL